MRMKSASPRHGAVVAFGLVLAASAGAIDASGCRAASGAGTTPLVELYTSEGCDSCPAADRWLSGGFLHGAGAGAPVALAFHVDYWDRLGWIDRFASPAWTERQYAAMRANRASFVYTPQFLLQGRDFGDWRRGTASAALDEIAARPARATIEMAATPDADGVAAIATGKVTDAKSGGGATLTIAYVDSGLVSDVRAGENRGARLTHDHVVRALRTSEPAGRGGTLALSARFSRPAEAGSVPTLVAFVQNPQDGDVLQALALRLSDCER
jgi:hypothetical protein